jgi:hypothetical protein
VLVLVKGRGKRASIVNADVVGVNAAGADVTAILPGIATASAAVSTGILGGADVREETTANSSSAGLFVGWDEFVAAV